VVKNEGTDVNEGAVAKVIALGPWLPLLD